MPSVGFSVPDGFSVSLLNGMPRLKIDVPKLLAFFGVRKWLKERALHAPQAVVDKIAPSVQMLAEAIAHDKGRQTPNADDFWRACEQTSVEMLYDGVLVKA